MNYRLSNHPALHYQDMLADAHRMQSYRQAIQAQIRPGDVVADLGTGLGVLAIMAAQAGARRVYAVEQRPAAAHLAKRLIAANGVADVVEVIVAEATTVQLPEPVDLIVNELIGDFGTDEDIVESVGAFAATNLKPNGHLLPQALRTALLAVEYGAEFRGVWRSDHLGLDLREAVTDPCTDGAEMVQLRYAPRELAAACTLEDLVFSAAMPERQLQMPFELEILSGGELQGFMGYFDATLCDGIALSNYPAYPGCHWRTWHWSVLPARRVETGQWIRGKVIASQHMVASAWTLQWQFDS